MSRNKNTDGSDSNRRRNYRNQEKGEEGIQFLAETLGCSDDVIEQVAMKVAKLIPSLRTRKKRIARFYRSYELLVQECKERSNAEKKFAKNIGEQGVKNDAAWAERCDQFQRKFGLGKLLERAEKVTGNPHGISHAFHYTKLSNDPDHDVIKTFKP